MPLPDDEDDKPTVVLDINALKKQKKEQLPEEQILEGSELQFNAHTENEQDLTLSDITVKKSIRIILFDFETNFFEKSLSYLPKDFDYIVVKNLKELNKNLKSKNFQIVVFNYDSNPKAVNQLCAQIKQKLPTTKTLILAKNISPEKAKAHSKTPFGANGYYQLPIDRIKLQLKFERIYEKEKKAS